MTFSIRWEREKFFGKMEAESARITRRRFMLAGAAAIASGCAPRKTEPQKPNIVVFLADALRADHLGCYGSAGAVSPTIDRFARNSVLFTRCFAQSCWTKPSVGSIFTGLLPRVHQAGIAHWDSPEGPNASVEVLRDQFETLAESLRAHGYRTALFETNPHIQDWLGFAQGFEHYRYVHAEDAAKQVDAVIGHLESDAKEPFFLFIHEMDPHGPYTPPPDVFERLYGTTPDNLAKTLPQGDRELTQAFDTFYVRQKADPSVRRPPLDQLSIEGLQFLKQLYDAEIAYVDSQFARLLNFLEETQLAHRTVVAFISDHGEAFGEHENFGHGSALYDEEIRVPLIIRLGSQQKGVRVPWNVSLYGLCSTLITLAGGTPPPQVQARTLLDQEGRVTLRQDRLVFADHGRTTVDGLLWQGCMVDGSFKVMSDGAGGLAVYDRSRDPGEQNDLLTAGTPPDDVVRARVALFLARQERHRALAESFGEPAQAETTEELRKQMEALGYV